MKPKEIIDKKFYVLFNKLQKCKDIKDFSFDLYLPKSYKHHFRITFWIPNNKRFYKNLESMLVHKDKILKQFLKEHNNYVIGINSKVGQYTSKHLLLLDIDNNIPLSKIEKILRGEPGFLFKTSRGYHFIGVKPYSYKLWKRKMKEYKSISIECSDHCDISFKRGYATLRITASKIKSIKPKFFKIMKGKNYE